MAATLVTSVVCMSMLSGTDLLVGVLERLCFGEKNLCDGDAAHAKLAHGC